MARKPIRSQLNQIRAWVRQGRTDAWIAHQLEVSASELRDFIRRNDLSTDEEAPDDADLRDEIEAEIEAAMESEEDEEDEDEDEDEEDDEEAGEGDAPDAGDDEGIGGREGAGRRRRRRRRRRPKRAGAGLQATFDHGESDGFGLWLDPAVEGDPVYTEHWKGHRRLEVTIEPEQIVIRRSNGD
jgi:hypothetical protein